MEPAQPQTAYLNEGEGETPLETAARLEAQENRTSTQTRQEEHEADVLVADIDQYVAQTDPASLPEAEQELDAWQIPTDPLEGIPANVVFQPNVEGEPLTAIFSAQTESEANIVRGLLEASGIPAAINTLSSPVLGGVFQSDETRWGDILVSASEAEAAQTVIAEATATGSENESSEDDSFDTQEAYHA